VRHFGFLFLILSVFSCGQVPEAEVENQENNGYFGNFPDSPFLNLTFNEEIDKQKALLIEKGFQFDEENHGVDQDEVEVFLGGDETLTSLKVLLFNQKQIDFESKTQFFAGKSSKNSISDHFATFEFDGNGQQYSLTMFMFEDMIRLNFRLKSSH